MEVENGCISSITLLSFRGPIFHFHIFHDYGRKGVYPGPKKHKKQNTKTWRDITLSHHDVSFSAEGIKGKFSNSGSYLATASTWRNHRSFRGH